MKILFTRFPLESTFGGAEVQVLSLMEGLMKRGHAVAFLGSCLTLLKECKERNIMSAQLDIGPPPVTKWGAISFFWRKKKMQRLLFAAMKQFHDLDAVIMLSLSEKLLLTPPLHHSSVPTLWLEHDRVGRWLTKNPWLGKLKKLSKQVTTIVVSELSKKVYVDLGWDSDKVIAIPNGIDPKRFTTNTTPNTPRPTPHIGCIARLTKDKGIDLLIEAVKDLSDVQLTIVGTGRDEKLIGKLANSQVSLVDRVDDLGNFYTSLDILVLPSREHDPFGLVAAEAMMLGVPVIVTTACGIANYLKNCEDAVIVKADSAQALKEGIKMLLFSEEKRKEIAKKGKKTAMEKFTVERMVDKYQELLS